MTDKIIENWAIAQKSGAWLPCPRCGKLTMKEDLYSNAFSRRANIYICDACGTNEALEDSPFVIGDIRKLSIGKWFVSRCVYRQPNISIKGDCFRVTVEHEIALTQENVDDIMACALEGGITYWADAADVIEEKRVADWGHEQIARGGALMIHDAEEDKTYELTLEKFLKGFALWVANGLDTCGAVSGGEVDCCNIDANDADSIIQFALFGDIIYG